MLVRHSNDEKHLSRTQQWHALPYTLKLIFTEALGIVRPRKLLAVILFRNSIVFFYRSYKNRHSAFHVTDVPILICNFRQTSLLSEIHLFHSLLGQLAVNSFSSFLSGFRNCYPLCSVFWKRILPFSWKMLFLKDKTKHKETEMFV